LFARALEARLLRPDSPRDAARPEEYTQLPGGDYQARSVFVIERDDIRGVASMNGMRKIQLLIFTLLAVVLSFGTSQASVGKRVALVIGNSAYRNVMPLPNPERDGRAVAAKLKELGFIVVEGYDLDQASFTTKIRDFSMAVRNADIGLVYYAGHGMQVNGRNYLVPVDAAFADASSLDFEAVPMDLVMRQMQGDVGVSVVILDACRNNPFSEILARSMSLASRSTALHEGLAEVKVSDAGKGTAIIFATSPDEVALDGDGGHSPFTAALLNRIDAPNTDLQVVMARITGDVYSATNKTQRPWMNASLTGEVLLNPTSTAKVETKPKDAQTVTPAPATDASKEADTLNRETALYNLARQSGAREDYLAYLETFPNGLYAANARMQLQRLDAEAAAKTQETKVAAVDRTGVADTTPTQPAADAVKSMPANKDTEAELRLDRNKLREIQARLNIAGFDTGTPDGNFGRRSRNAVANWQSSKGFPATGYFNQSQLDMLSLQTEAALSSYTPRKSSVSRKTVTTDQRNTSVRKVYKKAAQARVKVAKSDPQQSNRQSVDAVVFGQIVGGVLSHVKRLPLK
jgi:uncharacterized caspase-like protein